MPIKPKIINLLAVLELDKLDPKRQEAFLENAGRVIFQKVIARVTYMLSDAEKKEVEEMKNLDGDKLFDYLTERIPELDQIVMEEVEDFKEQSLQVLKAAGL